MSNNASHVCFSDIVATLPDIDHLLGLDICDANGTVVHHIAAQPGKMGSLRVYHALTLQFAGRLDAAAVAQGLEWFAEHVADARAHPGAHPNIDLLLKLHEQGEKNYLLRPIARQAEKEK